MFMLWEVRTAKAKDVDRTRHLILESSHPRPSPTTVDSPAVATFQKPMSTTSHGIKHWDPRCCSGLMV